MDNRKLRVLSLPTFSDLLAQTDLQARKSLGQNFLFDLNLTRRIARTAAPITGTIIEVGPGPGGLTRALILEGDALIIAVEKDSRVIAFLDHLVKAADGQLELREEDALNAPLWNYGSEPRQIVANLPYNIATPLLLSWLKHAQAFTGMSLMFQREVALRISAPHGTSAYGRISVMTQWLSHVELVFDVPAAAFTPPPKVTSSIIRIRPRPAPLAACQHEHLEAVTAIAFGQRRKMLRSSFKKYGGETMLASVGIEASARPQDLPVEAFCALARHLGPAGLLK